MGRMIVSLKVRTTPPITSLRAVPLYTMAADFVLLLDHNLVFMRPRMPISSSCSRRSSTHCCVLVDRGATHILLQRGDKDVHIVPGVGAKKFLLE